MVSNYSCRRKSFTYLKLSPTQFKWKPTPTYASNRPKSFIFSPAEHHPKTAPKSAEKWPQNSLKTAPNQSTIPIWKSATKPPNPDQIPPPFQPCASDKTVPKWPKNTAANTQPQHHNFQLESCPENCPKRSKSRPTWKPFLHQSYHPHDPKSIAK